MDEGQSVFLVGVVGTLLGVLLLVLLWMLFGVDEEEGDGVFIPPQLRTNDTTYALVKSPRLQAWVASVEPVVHRGDLNPGEITPELVLIRDRGITAFNFMEWAPDVGTAGVEAEAEAALDERTPLLGGFLGPPPVPYYVNEGLEIEFNGNNDESSAMLNLPLPIQNRRNDTVYFEAKVLEFAGVVTVGLATMPHPNWVSPGVVPYSLGINTRGEFVANGLAEPLGVFPVLQRGDIVGIGVRFGTGSLFVSHNGRNVVEVMRGLKFDMYPVVGAQGRAKVSVNLGQMGFVLIEGNVKKWGFCENNNEGQLGAPPMYGKVGDVVLDRGEALPPKYPEQGFFD